MQFETIRSFGASISTGKININEAERDQSILLKNMVNLIINPDQKQKKVRIKKYL